MTVITTMGDASILVLALLSFLRKGKESRRGGDQEERTIGEVLGSRNTEDLAED